MNKQQADQSESAVLHGRDLRVKKSLGLACIALLALSGCASTHVATGETDGEGMASATRDVGIDHLSQGRTAMAIRKLREAQALDPSDPVTHLSLGEAYRRKGLLEEAEIELIESLRLSDDPSDFNYQETLLNLSVLYIQMKRYEESIERAQTLVADPTFSSPWRALTNKGWAEFKLGRYGAARASFDEALDFHPRYAPAHLNLGILDQKERLFLPALNHYEQAVEAGRMAPNALAEANYRMAEVYVSLGNRGKAIEHFNVAVDRSPYGPWGEQSRSYLELLR
jgi:tetratricopeptide (TPR) repeat protein